MVVSQSSTIRWICIWKNHLVKSNCCHTSIQFKQEIHFLKFNLNGYCWHKFDFQFFIDNLVMIFKCRRAGVGCTLAFYLTAYWSNVWGEIAVANLFGSRVDFYDIFIAIDFHLITILNPICATVSFIKIRKQYSISIRSGFKMKSIPSTGLQYPNKLFNRSNSILFCLENCENPSFTIYILRK